LEQTIFPTQVGRASAAQEVEVRSLEMLKDHLLSTKAALHDAIEQAHAHLV